MTTESEQAQIVSASHYEIVAFLFAVEDHGMQVRSKMLSWLRLMADFLETKPRSDPTEEKLDAAILRSLVTLIEGLPTGDDGGGSRKTRDEVVRELFRKAA